MFGAPWWLQRLDFGNNYATITTNFSTLLGKGKQFWLPDATGCKRLEPTRRQKHTDTTKGCDFGNRTLPVETCHQPTIESVADVRESTPSGTYVKNYFCKKKYGYWADTETVSKKRNDYFIHGTRIFIGELLAAPQGFEPRYADPESAVLPLNEGAVSGKTMAFPPFRFYGLHRLWSTRSLSALKSLITARHKEHKW